MLELNRIYQGDCLELMKELPDNSIDMVLTDPPYNIGKDEWDKWKIPADYIKFCQNWILECQRVLKDNGSFYFFHNDMPTIAQLMVWTEQNTNFIFRQFIVWNKRFKGSRNKGFLDGYVQVDDLRNYQKMAEYILYYTFQDETGLSKVMGHCVYPSREYIRKEIKRAKGKVNLKEINTILGTAISGGGVASATLSLDKSQPCFITKEHYLRLREWLNNGTEYEYLRTEYEDLRYVFNNQKTHHSVWDFDFDNNKDEHKTPKPRKLIRNILKHSSKQGAIVLDLFVGDGKIPKACKELNRQYIGFELNPEYVEIANKRLRQESLSSIPPLKPCLNSSGKGTKGVLEEFL